jgi:Ca2+-binding RTX toxin-like protein
LGTGFNVYGGNGNDSIGGFEATGENSLYGGLGDDFYSVTSLGDKVIEVGGEGYDTVQVTVSGWRASAGSEIEKILVKQGVASVYGNEYANIIEKVISDISKSLSDGSLLDKLQVDPVQPVIKLR